MATLLLVEDERPMREFLAQALEDSGHRVLQAFHGQHALAVLAGTTERPDLVLADVMMPLVGGVELCRTLKADPHTADIPVILMSSALGRSVTAASGADALIAKPFDLDALDALIAGVLAPPAKA